MDISIGIMAFNEEKNIGRLLKALLSQELKKVKIREIIVVSVGSTDKTNKIVEKFTKKNKVIKLVTGDKRRGKALAINEFINISIDWLKRYI